MTIEQRIRDKATEFGFVACGFARADAAPEAGDALREWLAVQRESQDLVSVGAYVAGSNPRLDEALARHDRVEAVLCQPADTTCGFADALEALRAATA